MCLTFQYFHIQNGTASHSKWPIYVRWVGLLFCLKSGNPPLLCSETQISSKEPFSSSLRPGDPMTLAGQSLEHTGGRDGYIERLLESWLCHQNRALALRTEPYIRGGTRQVQPGRNSQDEDGQAGHGEPLTHLKTAPRLCHWVRPYIFSYAR